MRPLRFVPPVALCALAAAVPAQGQVAPDRPAGPAFAWGHALNQNELPSWDPKRAPVIAPARWYRTVDRTLADAGRAGLWVTGASALPFRVPLHPKEPTAWRTHRNFLDLHRRTGLAWDVNVEIWAARIALRRRGTVVVDPSAEPTAYTRRLSLLDPRYRAAALAEIRRLVPAYADQPYVNAYTGSDEPIIVLPRGAAATRSAYARRMRAEVRRRYGWPAPAIKDRPSAGVAQGLRWLAYTRWSQDGFFAMKAAQARAIRRLDPAARVASNTFGFIDGFIPWDYSRVAAYADVVEGDPYISYDERDQPGRGRYNPGFAAKLLADLTDRDVRITIQAFPYSRYRPTPRDLGIWSAQALRAGASEISFFASDNPRVTARPRYAAMLDVAAKLRGTRLPPRPQDPTQLVVYATASEGQAQPFRNGNKRHRTKADGLYTTHALLGELGHGAYRFDSDARLAREPARLAAARTVWLPRGETLDRPFADALAGWVRAGGTLIVTDPDAFTRAPDGRSLADLRAELIGAELGAPRPGRDLTVPAGALAAGAPARALALPLAARTRRAFSGLPAGASVIARYGDDAPAAISRAVGAGRVIAFAVDPMQPGVLDAPGDWVRLVRDLHRIGGGRLDHPAWSYSIPGLPASAGLPWRTAVAPADATS